MQNEFEKQVQQKMEELKLVPSAPVWENVEKQIRKKRERKRFLFFLLPVMLLAGAGILWMLEQGRQGSLQSLDNTTIKQKAEKNNFENRASNPQTKIQTPVTQGPEKTKTNSEIETSGADTKKKETGKDPFVFSKPFNRVSKSKIIQPNEEGPVIKKLSAEQFRQPKTVRRKENMPNNGVAVTELDPKNNSIPPPVEKKEQFQNNQKLLPIISANENPKEQKTTGGVSEADSVKKEETLRLVKPLDSSAGKKIAGAGNKWEKIFTFRLGESMYKNGIFSGRKSLMDYVPNANTGGGFSPVYDSSGSGKKGFSFAIGAGVKRNFGKRMELTAAVQYHYYSTHGKVGEKKNGDTAVFFWGNRLTASGFYTNTGTKEYTTEYGIIEIPVSFHYRLIKKIPLQFSAGASYGRLLYSNALTFDASRNFFYYNEKNNVKNFISIFSSLQYRIFTKNRAKIVTGPMVQFMPSLLQRENRFASPHLFFAGIKTDISF